MTTASKGAMNKIYSYARTMKSKSDYAHNMSRLSAQIFGEVDLQSYIFSMMNVVVEEAWYHLLSRHTRYVQ